MNDLIIIEAYRRTLSKMHLSADELVCTPAAREMFLDSVRGVTGSNISERDLLWRLLCLRKRSRLPRLCDVSVTGDGPLG